jgi:hypothetical protein
VTGDLSTRLRSDATEISQEESDLRGDTLVLYEDRGFLILVKTFFLQACFLVGFVAG